MAGVKKRSYDMANRSRLAADTRRRVVEAASRLFLRHGYAATSMNAIAAEAGVAVQTVYASMKTKRDILEKVIQLTVRGEEDDVPIAASTRWRQMEAEADARAKLAMFARIHREICDREARLFVVLESAAAVDADTEPLLRDKERFRYEDQTRVARSLWRQGQLRNGLPVRKASDIIWALASERVYLALVQERGWSIEAYETWLTDQLTGALLPV
ncbi:MAG: TetR/AcrR family transcriptional regulator [Actinomycetota bacterium]|nr:TetR/AcrR family transcriptional regulator [Actinomycetota bacterium]